jgi:hypothetical protein
MAITRSVFMSEARFGSANDWRDGIAGVFFDRATTSPEDYVTIDMVRIRTRGGNYLGNVADLPEISLLRITGITGGEPITVTKRDTTDADLPSQVLLRERPDGITGAGSVFRQEKLSFGLSGPLGGSLATRTYNGTGARAGTAAVFSRRSTGTVIDSIILQEGEGVALTMPVVRLPMVLDYNFTIRNVATGVNYVADFFCPTVRNNDMATFALLNGTGSGVTLAVDVVHLPISRRNNYLTALTDKQWRIAVFEGRRTAYGSDQLTNQEPLGPVTPFDTTKPAPAGVHVLDGPFLSRLVGERWNALIDWNTTQASAVAPQHRLGTLFRRSTYVPEINATVAQPLGANFERHLMPGIRSRGYLPVKITPGYGLAVLAGSEGAISGDACQTYDVEMIWSYYAVDSTGGSGTYPLVGDVDTGVTYGPNGNDFTGTLVQPLVVDVRSGIQYGAGGTEFTGTYAGGGGGNTYSKSRVVNKG